MALPIEFDPRATNEVRRAQGWYARRSASVAARFAAALDVAVNHASQTPRACSPHIRGTRIVRVRRFPYWVVFVEEPHRVYILAVKHSSRRPSYWRRRLP